MNELHLGVLPYGREYNGTFDYSDTDGIRLGSFQIPSILITPDENLLLQYPSLHGCVAYFINRSLDDSYTSRQAACFYDEKSFTFKRDIPHDEVEKLSMLPDPQSLELKQLSVENPWIALEPTRVSMFNYLPGVPILFLMDNRSGIGRSFRNLVGSIEGLFRTLNVTLNRSGAVNDYFGSGRIRM